MPNETKKKSQPAGMREPKAKKLNLQVPSPLRFPHTDLFPPLQSLNEAGSSPAPVAIPDESISDTGNSVKPVAESNRTESDTGLILTPVVKPNQSTNNTGNANKPEARTNQSIPDTGLQTTLVATRPVATPTPVAKTSRSISATGPTLPPVLEANPYQEPKSKFFKTPNEVSDVVQARLSDEEFNLYFRLFRLSHGHRKATCFVGYTALARALNWSLSKVKRVMPRVLQSGYVRVVETYNGPDLKGSVYEVFTGATYEPVSLPDQSDSDTGGEIGPNKYDDHDYKYNLHQKEVMRIYKELTGNVWTKADTAQYNRLQDFTAEEIELHMRAIKNRASGKIGSFAFFVTGIENEISDGGSRQGWSLEKRYYELAKELAAAFVGADDPPSEQIARLKARCIREGISWSDDLANKVLGL